MSDERLQGESESEVEAALAKLDAGDREIVLARLRKAERTEAELRYLADHDSLTGLLDRRRFRAELDQYVSFSARYGGQGAVMIVDIDGLKAVNDTLGHQAGDNLIRQVAETLRERVRGTDIVARLSGDEFAVLMPQTDTAGALALGEDLRAQVAEGERSAAEPISTTISVGITMFGGGRGGAEAVLAAADQAMYRAKEDGRNQIALFRDPSEPKLGQKRHQTTAARIRDALSGERLSLHTQPIRSLASGGIERYELLLRMTDEDGALLPAASFIEAAERSGMVQELDRWVVGRALELLAEREQQGRPLSLHVNLSGASLTDISVLEFIERRLDEGGADPSHCTFEITETANVYDYDRAARFRRPADRVRLPGGDRRLRRRFRPLPLPEEDPLRPDQDRRLLRPRHAALRRRPADRQGDRADRPRARQVDDRRVRAGRRDDRDAARVRGRHGPGLPPRPSCRPRRGLRPNFLDARKPSRSGDAGRIGEGAHCSA